MKSLVWLLFAQSAWAHPTTVLEATTFEGAALVSVSLCRSGLSQSL
jgi:hypothetical protein